jgi:hypothetical protein
VATAAAKAGRARNEEDPSGLAALQEMAVVRTKSVVYFGV